MIHNHKKSPTANVRSSRVYRARHPDRVAAAQLRRMRQLHGWTPERVTEMLHEQAGVCAICHKPFKKTPCADHKHSSPPKPRGLLCINCNALIGALENVKWFSAAMTYLKRWA